MQAISIADASLNLENLLKRVIDNSEPTIVLLDSGDKVVLMPLDEYNTFAETSYLLASPANAAHLFKSISEANRGESSERELLKA